MKEKIDIETSIRERALWFLDHQQENMGTHLGMQFLKMHRDELIATMPVDHRTVQPFRVLHGGASVALAETLCSVGAWLNVSEGKTAVGVEINANHHRSVSEGGQVTATARPLQLGRTLQVWEIRIEDQRGKLVCTSRCTLAVIDQKKAP